ncbi:MAG: transglutaminase family protein [Pontiellaceae bacterium]|nr:transglutaminase family protein [Pontiellaceae bacterium]MBN2783465.1 transglutaminase family protein [Pontiellaceae bacterium]
MAIRVALHHTTHYHYDRPVQLDAQLIRLRPTPHCRTPIVSYSLKILPKEHFINWVQDPQNNHQARLVFPETTEEFVVQVDLVAELKPINPFDFFLEKYAENYPFDYAPSLRRELDHYLEPLPTEPLFSALLDEIDASERGIIDFLSHVNQLVNKRLNYTLRMDPGVYSPEETLSRGEGSCRDFAWLLVHLFRSKGLAARFVSGYSIQLVADEKPVDPDAPAGVSKDVCDLHAWCEVYLPGAGWVGLDATSGLFCGEGHIPLTASSEALGAAPIEGALSPCKVDFDVEMNVTRMHEDPRVTKPYSDGQWQAILNLGDQVDRALQEGDVRLSMGGEPTFVSATDMEGEEWNGAATGPTKKTISEKLIRRLRDRFAPGGLLHFGQGKWYPGEPLPRWAIGLYWRRDGHPIWHSEELIACEEKDYGYGHEQARLLTEEITRQLNVPDRYIAPAFEDPIRFSLREEDLPLNIDPFDCKLDDAREREKLLRLFRQGLENPIGYVLPIQRRIYDKDGPTWHSGLWMLRSKHLFVIPGDSPLGLRLPLERLPWVHPDDRQVLMPDDPSAFRNPLPPPAPRVRQQANKPPTERKAKEADQWPKINESAEWVVRTALCVEARRGRLYVFMPPLSTIEDYLDLVSAVEAAAAATGMPVLLEGYTPPHDPRIENMKVTPDPGVIEVNIQPAHSWWEMVNNTHVLYEEARQWLLRTDKFQLDGRHTGTCGGNHVVVGGATPADSPFLRRPDLLKSLIGYWNNHPSLSYLFSGLFIGPTSQAPRMDEGRPEAAYEMEIAFRQIPDPGGNELPPWLVDRVFRHLLTDLTGNTHRAEFCIDKLYSPDSTTGRLGLVEFRGFEMPPHARMSLTQQLLLRALIAHFWNNPYREPLTRWGSGLHDRFLLPHFVSDDFSTVINDLNKAGFPFRQEWFETHYEFRFPIIGTVQYDEVTIELRRAIEPWLVLGEEAGAGGTVRYVDSSLERLQVHVTGMDSKRQSIAVNGIEIPLTPTGKTGEFVAGVRYRAWQPPSCLHPTIPPHAPLVFDLLDIYNAHAIGGCTYFVSHPGGRSHEVFPINALEAETRRAERFKPFGHTPGPMLARRLEHDIDSMVTLDLRRA